MLRRGAQWLSATSEGWVLPNADFRVRFQDARHHRASSTSIFRSGYLPHRSLSGISAILNEAGHSRPTPTVRRTNSQVGANVTFWGA